MPTMVILWNLHGEMKMTDEKFLIEMIGMICDVNVNEIKSHDTDDSLQQWCSAWQHAACVLLCKAFLGGRSADVRDKKP